MFFRTVASIAFLAVTASASAKPQPYKLAMMPVAGMSLVRRDTSGYIPEETVCGDGNTCDEACGAGYTQCASNDAAIHCFNPEAQQSCCTDGTGNSCEAGYYCTHDTTLQTWCCPDAMDLAECAAAYSITGGLETPKPTTSAAASTSAAPSTTSAPVSTPISSTSSQISTSAYEGTSSKAWSTGANSTMTSPTHSSTKPSVPEPTASTPATPTGAAAGSGVSLSLLVAAAGFVALF